MSIADATILGIIIFGLPLLLVLMQPILSRTGRPLPDAAALEVEELFTERERSYTALTDLDFDYECGKISAEDYESVREALIDETALVLAQIDERIAETQQERARKTHVSPRTKPTVTVSEDAIEREIRAFRKQRKPASRTHDTDGRTSPE